MITIQKYIRAQSLEEAWQLNQNKRNRILGGMLCGVSRPAGAEFSFFLAIPVMLGASFLKLLKFGFAFTTAEIVILIAGTLVAFITSLIAIRFLVSFVRRHSFAVFGYYRIVLGVLVLGYFLIKNGVIA